MLCLHYYSNHVTLRVGEEDGEYRLDQIKEFESVDQGSWNDILAAHAVAGMERL